MTSRRKPFLATIAIAVGIVLLPALSGCSNPLESVVEGVTGGNVDIGGASVPDDFPEGIPLIEGDIVNGSGFGKGADKSWTIIVKVDGASAADRIKEQLDGAGFTEDLSESAGGATGIAYANENYRVIVGVTEDGNKGWIATYLVTPVS